MSIYFISGIDTDIGKTVAVGMMARSLCAAGKRTITLKLVQTGNDRLSEDILRHREIMETGLMEADQFGWTMPQIFHFPASPHLAAKLEGKTVDLDKIDEAAERLAGRYEIVLAEGAGGLAVPMTEDLLAVDFARIRQWPVILVTSGRLGSLNHTLMSLEMLQHRQMKLAGIVYNWSKDADPVIDSDSYEMLLKYLPRYGFASTPVVRLGQVVKPYGDVDFSAIFSA